MDAQAVHITIMKSGKTLVECVRGTAKTMWCNGDGGFWCNEDCKLLQVRPITRKRKVEKILSNSDAVYVLYADGTWRKNEK